MIELPMHNRAGEVIAHVKVDDCDAEWARQFKWHRLAGYAARGTTRGSKKTGYVSHSYYMHRELLGLGHGDPREGDHRNRNKLDNRRANLRIVNRGQQMQNLPSRPGSSSEFRGVSWCNTYKKWRVQVQVAGVHHSCGSYDDELEAAAVAVAWREELMSHAVEDVS